MSRFRDKSPVTLDDQAADMLLDLDHWERRCAGSLEIARRVVARRIGLSHGSLERVRRRRTKGVKGFVIQKIRAAFLPGLAAERARLARALVLAEGGCLDLGGDAAREALALLDRAQNLIDDVRRGA